MFGGDTMFFGREKEIETLEKRYHSGKFEFFTIRGRRRVGKSTLLREFCRDKTDVIFFSAQETTALDNLSLLSNEVTRYLQTGQATYDSYQTLFEDIFEASKQKRIIFIIDEFPYLANSNTSIMSMLQNLIDNYEKESKLFLILCGSSISFMENEVLAYKAPLYGRSTGQLKIEPFSFYDAQPIFENFSMQDKITMYAIFGGIPAYLNFVEDTKTVKENVIDCFFDKSTVIYDEPNMLLKEELREPAIYNSIINAIATGSSKLNEIATKTNMDSAKAVVYLKKLIELQIVHKENPVTETELSKKSIYKLEDNLFKFWYRFIAKNKTSIEFDYDKDSLYEDIIRPYLEDYTGRIFEEICKQFFLRHISSKEVVPFSFHQIGRWWGTNPKWKREEEIDLLMFTNDEKKACMVECKWRNEPVGMSVLEELMEKATCLPQFEQKYYGICSKSGFKPELIQYAKEHENVRLYDLDRIIQ